MKKNRLIFFSFFAVMLPLATHAEPEKLTFKGRVKIEGDPGKFQDVRVFCGVQWVTETGSLQAFGNESTPLIYNGKPQTSMDGAGFIKFEISFPVNLSRIFGEGDANWACDLFHNGSSVYNEAGLLPPAGKGSIVMHSGAIRASGDYTMERSFP